MTDARAVWLISDRTAAAAPEIVAPSRSNLGGRILIPRLKSETGRPPQQV
jgi:hypothetical protein